MIAAIGHEDDGGLQQQAVCTQCGGKGKIKVKVGDPDCFPEYVPVFTPRGWIEIGDIRRGDFVLSVKSPSLLQPVRVTRKVVHRLPSIRTYSIISDVSSLSFHGTASHPVRTKQGWKRIGALNIGDKIFGVDFNGNLREHTVREKNPVDDAVAVHNLIVDGNHTFIPQGCLAHSFVNLRTLREILNRTMNGVNHSHSVVGSGSSSARPIAA